MRYVWLQLLLAKALQLLASAEIFLLGSSVSAVVDGGTWTASLTIPTGAVEGAVSWSVALTDVAGNTFQSTTFTAGTNGASVVVDTHVAIASANIASSNALPTRARQGDTVRVTVTGAEVGKHCSPNFID